jgi:predicted dehydrogenase
MGLIHAAITNAVGRAKVVAMADSDDRLVRTGQRILPRIKFFRDYVEMLQSVRPDCVYVCTPPATHAEIVSAALSSGLSTSIFVEKPLATSRVQVEQLAHLATQKRVVGMVGFQKRFNPVFSEVKRLLETDEIGSPILVRAHSFTPGVLGPALGWRGDPKSGGATLEWGIHLLDLVLWLFGTPLSSNPYRSRVFSEKVEDFAMIQLTFPRGVSGVIELGWSMRNFSPPSLVIEVQGTAGTLVADEDRLAIYPGSRDSESVAGRIPAIVRHVTQLSGNPAYLLGQPENVLEEVHFQKTLDGMVPPQNSFSESIALHDLVDRIRSAPLA